MTTAVEPDGLRLGGGDVVVLFAHLQPAIVANSGSLSPKLIEAGAAALAQAASIPPILNIPLKPSMCGRAASSGYQISHEQLTGALLDGLTIPYVVCEPVTPKSSAKRLYHPSKAVAATFC